MPSNYSELLVWCAMMVVGTMAGNFIAGFLRGLRKRGITMMDLIRRAVYRSGRRPKADSVFFSESLSLKMRFLEAVKKQPFPVVIHPQNRAAWSEVAANLRRLKEPTPDDATPASLFQALNFCPMCGTPLTVLVLDVKECPHGHGNARVFESPDGLPAILFEPSEGEPSDGS